MPHQDYRTQNLITNCRRCIRRIEELMNFPTRDDFRGNVTSSELAELERYVEMVRENSKLARDANQLVPVAPADFRSLTRLRELRNRITHEFDKYDIREIWDWAHREMLTLKALVQ